MEGAGSSRIWCWVRSCVTSYMYTFVDVLTGINFFGWYSLVGCILTTDAFWDWDCYIISVDFIHNCKTEDGCSFVVFSRHDQFKSIWNASYGTFEWTITTNDSRPHRYWRFGDPNKYFIFTMIMTIILIFFLLFISGILWWLSLPVLKRNVFLFFH